jgi:hypothetical protein
VLDIPAATYEEDVAADILDPGGVFVLEDDH